MKPLLTATGLGLPGRLHDTALTVAPGSLMCLIGPNGSGKTSLLHALAGIGGSVGMVRVDGANPGDCAPAARQRLLAFLPASKEVRWPLPARDLVALGQGSTDAIERAMQTLDIAHLADRRVDRLSTGERSRVLIARALAAEPKLLLLDEPVANLDPLWQLRLMDHLATIAASGTRSVIVAAHDLEVARVYADRLMIMHEGRIAADGEPGELLAGPHVPRIFGVERRNGAWRPVA